MVEPYLSENHQKEAFSYAYLYALAAECGYSCQKGPQPDTDGIDATVRAKGGMRTQIDVQLKATSSPVVRAGALRVRVTRKQYDDLREKRQTPLVLVALELPGAREDWLAWSPEELVMRRRAWWTVLEGSLPIETSSTSVQLPGDQLLSPHALRKIMARAARGELT